MCRSFLYNLNKFTNFAKFYEKTLYFFFEICYNDLDTQIQLSYICKNWI